MFRLADLYLDQAKYEWDEKEAAMAMNPAPPPAPADDENFDTPLAYYGPDFTPSIDIWRDIGKRFPEYRQIDGTIYLLAYYLGELRPSAATSNGAPTTRPSSSRTVTP